MNVRRCYAYAIIIAAMLAMFDATGYAQPVDIPDANLRAAIQSALGLPNDATVTRDAIRQLVHLDIVDAGVTDLTGIELASKLESIFMWRNRGLSDITPLGMLTKLREIHASVCHISDVTPLAQLPALEVLALLRNPVSDIQPLANLTTLRVLNLAGCGITDIRTLAGLTSLTTLHLETNQITDVTPLANLTRLYFTLWELALFQRSGNVE